MIYMMIAVVTMTYDYIFLILTSSNFKSKVKLLNRLRFVWMAKLLRLIVIMINPMN